MITILVLLVGLAVLTAGAELLVRGASRLAVTAGISSLVVGLTVVAFGTSAPELVVSVQSAILEKPDVALGNVIGSNIFNVLFILGISALIVPLRVSLQLIRIEVPLMIGVSCLAFAFALDGRIGRIDGSILVIGLLLYTYYSILMSRRQEAAYRAILKEEGLSDALPKIPEGRSLAKEFAINAALVAVGLLLLVIGAQWFIESAIAIARQLGASELIIGLTLVAAGTSLPEVATSIMAAIRGERDIAVGNVVGSNLFNIMGVLGVSSCITPQGINVSDVALWLDLPVMIAVAFACLPIFYTGHSIDRWEGGLFLAYYFLYTAYLIVAATLPELTRNFALAMCILVIPLTLITLLIGVVRHYRRLDKRDGCAAA